jgi:hypothetical protein
MSRTGPRVASVLFQVLLLGFLAITPHAPAEAQTSLFDPRFEEVRRASVAWDNRNGPEREVVDIVCLVPDVSTYFEAIATWDERHFFPILIDDVQYTLPFLRAFRPARIVRFPGKGDTIAPEALWGQAVSAVGRSWSSGEATSPKDVPRGDVVPKWLGATPPGIILSHAESAALPGAVALAAGRFQPLVNWTTPKKFKDKLTIDEARVYARSLENYLAKRAIAYDQLGDDCDFVTLAGDYPFKYEGPGRTRLYETAGEPSAFDDLILRDESTGKRWGFAGRLLGDAPSSVYRAMCSLFLHPRAAILINTYEDRSPPWNTYLMTESAARLTSLFPVTHRASERASLTGWHQAFDPVNRYGLTIINTSGSPTSFNIPGGPGHTADIPEGNPTAVSIIHSFSAEAPDDPETIAGRWLANGAFLYYGAVFEPYLDAFRPPSLAATFLNENLPVVASVRRSGIEPFGEPWRLVFLGDPLYRLKPLGALTRRADWNKLDGWMSYTEFRQPGAEVPESERFHWALKTAIFRLQTGKPPRQKAEIADVLLAIARDKLETALRPLYDDLVSDTLLQANRGTELRELLVRVPADARSPNLVRHLETVQTSALQRAVASNDLRLGVSLWQEVIRVKGSRDFSRMFTERVGKLADSAGKRNDWQSRLHTTLRAGSDPSNREVIEQELKRIEGR